MDQIPADGYWFFNRFRYLAIFCLALTVVSLCADCWFRRKQSRDQEIGQSSPRIFGRAFFLWLGYLFSQIPLRFHFEGIYRERLWQRPQQPLLPDLVLELSTLCQWFFAAMLQDAFPWVALALCFLPLYLRQKKQREHRLPGGTL